MVAPSSRSSSAAVASVDALSAITTSTPNAAAASVSTMEPRQAKVSSAWLYSTSTMLTSGCSARGRRSRSGPLKNACNLASANARIACFRGVTDVTSAGSAAGSAGAAVTAAGCAAAGVGGGSAAKIAGDCDAGGAARPPRSSRTATRSGRVTRQDVDET